MTDEVLRQHCRDAFAAWYWYAKEEARGVDCAEQKQIARQVYFDLRALRERAGC